MNIGDLLGSVVQSGMSQSSTSRIQNSLGGGGLLDSLAGMLGGASSGGSQGGGGLLDSLSGMLGGATGTTTGGAPGGTTGSLTGGLLGNILKEAGRAVGGNQNLAIGGLGALAGLLLGGRKGVGGALRGSLGGGVMALLGAMAYQALKGKLGQSAQVPLGLAKPQTAAEEAELARNSELVLKAMLNAAKADGQIDEGEIKRILGNVKKTGVDKESQAFLSAEMKKPMATDELVAAARGKPALAAQLYSASLLAIEVDTPAEKQYLAQLASSLGLDPQVTQSLHQVVGLAA